jgi:hypothetical protein
VVAVADGVVHALALHRVRALVLHFEVWQQGKILKPILRSLNLQLQRRRCSRLECFSTFSFVNS